MTAINSFTMPIIHTRFSVTWNATPEDETQARANHGGQSLQVLANRGGLDWSELHAILEHERYEATVRIEDLSRQCVNTILRQRAGIEN
jgi:hypothetical protein